MAQATIKIQGLDELQKVFKKAPQETVKQLKRAVEASVFEVKKNANDNAFRFKTPRGRRSGQLQISFAHGIEIRGLRGKIGPTKQYAVFVHEGTSRGISPNYFMPRIAKNSQKGVNKHFKDAVDNVIKLLAI